MLHLDPEQQMVGKTIESIDASCVNAWTIRFTDGSSYEIRTEQAINTAAGPIPGLTLWWSEQELNEK